MEPQNGPYPALSMFPPRQYLQSMPHPFQTQQMPHEMLFGQFAQQLPMQGPGMNAPQPVPMGTLAPAPMVSQSAPGAWNGGDQAVSAMESSTAWGYGQRQYGAVRCEVKLVWLLQLS